MARSLGLIEVTDAYEQCKGYLDAKELSYSNAEEDADGCSFMVTKKGVTVRLWFNHGDQQYGFDMAKGGSKVRPTFDEIIGLFEGYILLYCDVFPTAKEIVSDMEKRLGIRAVYKQTLGNVSEGYGVLFQSANTSYTIKPADNGQYVVQVGEEDSVVEEMYYDVHEDDTVTYSEEGYKGFVKVVNDDFDEMFEGMVLESEVNSADEDSESVESIDDSFDFDSVEDPASDLSEAYDLDLNEEVSALQRLFNDYVTTVEGVLYVDEKDSPVEGIVSLEDGVLTIDTDDVAMQVVELADSLQVSYVSYTYQGKVVVLPIDVTVFAFDKDVSISDIHTAVRISAVQAISDLKAIDARVTHMAVLRGEEPDGELWSIKDGEINGWFYNITEGGKLMVDGKEPDKIVEELDEQIEKTALEEEESDDGIVEDSSENGTSEEASGGTDEDVIEDTEEETFDDESSEETSEEISEVESTEETNSGLTLESADSGSIVVTKLIDMEGEFTAVRFTTEDNVYDVNVDIAYRCGFTAASRITSESKQYVHNGVVVTDEEREKKLFSTNISDSSAMIMELIKRLFS